MTPFATAIATELSVTASVPARTLMFRRRTSEDDERDAEAAEAERQREEGKQVIKIGPGDPPIDTPGDGPLIEHEPQPSNKD